MSGHHLVADERDRVEVAGEVDLFAQELLGRHIGGDADRVAVGGDSPVVLVGPQRFGQGHSTQSPDLTAAAAELNGLGGDVAVHDGVGVDRVKPAQNAIHHTGCQGPVEAVAPRHVARERFSAGELGHEDRMPFLGDPVIEHGHDVGVADALQQPNRPLGARQ